MNKSTVSLLVACVAVVATLVAVGVFALQSTSISYTRANSGDLPIVKLPPPLDTHAYDLKMLAIAHVATSSPWYRAFLAGTSTPLDVSGNATTTSEKKPLWPVKTVYPNAGALLPFNRIVAYYGNFYSTGMGVLGEYAEEVMLAKLASTTAMWEAADPSTPVIPAIHYIVETAQASPTKSGLYLARMPDSQIDHALELAKKINGVVFIDFQVALSTLEKELPQYEAYLSLPNVHLGIDPEFSMKTGAKPGTVIGSFDAADINFAMQYLAGLVREHNLPPKILIVHRFTHDMVTNAEKIQPLPEVQFVMDMDGWGDQAKKIGTYTHVVAAEPVQFTGFKLFYKNDTFPPSTGVMTPSQVIKLTPAPIYIQYQ